MFWVAAEEMFYALIEFAGYVVVGLIAAFVMLTLAFYVDHYIKDGILKSFIGVIGMFVAMWLLLSVFHWWINYV